MSHVLRGAAGSMARAYRHGQSDSREGDPGRLLRAFSGSKPVVLFTRTMRCMPPWTPSTAQQTRTTGRTGGPQQRRKVVRIPLGAAALLFLEMAGFMRPGTNRACNCWQVSVPGRSESGRDSQQGQKEDQVQRAQPDVDALQPGIANNGQLDEDPYHHSETGNRRHQQRPMASSEQGQRCDQLGSAQDAAEDGTRDERSKMGYQPDVPTRAPLR